MDLSPLKAASLREATAVRPRIPARVKRWARLLVLAVLVLTVVARLVLLSPSRLEDKGVGSNLIEPQTLLSHDKVTLAPGIPTDRVPEYTIDKFDYISTQGAEKQWNLLASRANMYNAEKLVHAREVTAYLFNPDGKPTIVRGLEAKYFMNQKDLEVFGNVKTVFPDGFELDSEYLRYRPGEKIIEIPEKYLVHGHGKPDEPAARASTTAAAAAPTPAPSGNERNQNLTFISHGLTYEMKRSEIFLRRDVKASVSQPNPTQIVSDQCLINRERQVARFTMFPSRPLGERFVHLTQPTLFAKGRTAELNYGDFDKMLNYLILHDDTLVKEVGTDSLRYATAGQADFDSQRNVIILRQYPQVYQDQDTVTGDVIVMHRDTDVVEVEHSNGFSQGTQ